MGRLEEDIDEKNVFLKKYVRNKVKFDFMEATHEIVKAEIKSVYAEKNEGVFILLKNFTNYFTLNYDSLLYLLLLKYKTKEIKDKNSIAFQPTIKFIEEDLNVQHNNIYSEIKDLRDNGLLTVSSEDNNASMRKSLSMLPKKTLINTLEEYSKSKSKGWKTKDINKVVDLILEEEKDPVSLKIKFDDGSSIKKDLFGAGNEFIFDPNSKTQNLFFLHGAFHIYKDGKSVKKITQPTDKALYKKLEEIINNEEKDIVCVFQHKNKTDAIENNEYLLNCLKKLGQLKGNMIIIGSSLADNDNHIFDKISSSDIETLYISTMPEEKDVCINLAKQKFPSKKIMLFNAKTISYELTDEKLA